MTEVRDAIFLNACSPIDNICRCSVEWVNEGACVRHDDPELWFPETDRRTRWRKDAEYVAQVGRAAAICRTCPVQQACLDFALAHREPFGVWGGLAPQERNKPAQLSMLDVA